MQFHRLPGSRSVLNGCKRAFTLVEILVSIVILLILMVALFQVTATLAKVWTSSRGKISAFENARFAFSTLTSTLSRATLNTYVDYANYNTTNTLTGPLTFRTATTTASFLPTQFGRASELHFLSGPASTVMVPVLDPGNTNPKLWNTPTGNANNIYTNPGHVVYFQAPLGITNAASFTGMNRMINSVAFYVQYEQPPKGLLPNWLGDAASKKDYRYRLMEFVEPSENLTTYYSTSLPTYDSTWTNFAAIVRSTDTISTVKPRARILAEDVLLLVIRPRVSITDEKTIATKLSGNYAATKAGSYISPKYIYDSRAWVTPATNTITTRLASSNASKLAQMMCNQVPPIVDVAMVCADAQSLARYSTASATPPTAFSPSGLFLDSSKMEDDLNTFVGYLVAKKVNFHIMRSSVQIQSSRWANN